MIYFSTTLEDDNTILWFECDKAPNLSEANLESVALPETNTVIVMGAGPAWVYSALTQSLIENYDEVFFRYPDQPGDILVYTHNTKDT